jgi:hypothetical protein
MQNIDITVCGKKTFIFCYASSLEISQPLMRLGDKTCLQHAGAPDQQVALREQQPMLGQNAYVEPLYQVNAHSKDSTLKERRWTSVPEHKYRQSVDACRYI